MQVRLLKRSTIESYVRKNANSRTGFENWYGVVKIVDWKIPEDFKKTFSSTDILGRRSNRVVFNISGNKYRMICKYMFGTKYVHLYISWIGTHAEYTKLCEKSLQYKVSQYKGKR